MTKNGKEVNNAAPKVVPSIAPTNGKKGPAAYSTMTGLVATIFERNREDLEQLARNLAKEVASVVKVEKTRIEKIDGKPAIVQQVVVKPARGRNLYDLRKHVYSVAYETLAIDGVATFQAIGLVKKKLTEEEAQALVASEPSWKLAAVQSCDNQRRPDAWDIWARGKDVRLN